MTSISSHIWTQLPGNPQRLRHLIDNYEIANDRVYPMKDGNLCRQYRRVNGHEVFYVAADGRGYPASERNRTA